MEIIDQDDGHRLENINLILDVHNGKVEELISYNQLLDNLETAQEVWIKSPLNSEPSLDIKVH